MVETSGGMMRTERSAWVARARRVAEPVLNALASESLRATMPVEQKNPTTGDRGKYSHLEAVGRLLAGLSPWLESSADDPARADLARLARRGVAVATDPNSPDYLNFGDGAQPLVDTAFLAQAMLRAPKLLWEESDAQTRRNIVAAMKCSRRIKPAPCNWLLFSATVEAFLAMAGEDWDPMRVDYALHQHEQWYKGDGAYGDGPSFRWDYYNSFVIQPMLLDVLAEVTKHRSDWDGLKDPIYRRAQRFAVVMERLIAPDGTFPVIGRSIAYRGGAFQLLAQLALLKRLPAELPPAQVRTALSAVIERTLDAPKTFDKAGWLRIGLCGHQPSLGEPYISTGSLYLCSLAFLPLGLTADDAFWSDAPQPFTSQRVWSGEDIPADHAMKD